VTLLHPLQGWTENGWGIGFPGLTLRVNPGLRAVTPSGLEDLNPVVGMIGTSRESENENAPRGRRGVRRAVSYFFSALTSRAFGFALAHSAHFLNPFLRASSDSKYWVE
jgi:hypothetical protein